MLKVESVLSCMITGWLLLFILQSQKQSGSLWFELEKWKKDFVTFQSIEQYKMEQRFSPVLIFTFIALL